MKEAISQEFGILILSTDKLYDLWPVALDEFFKNFDSDKYNYPIYFGSNELIVNDSRVVSVLSGQDIDWSSSYLNILKQIKCKKILVLLEDLIVTSTINSIDFDQLINFGLFHNAIHIKYWPTNIKYKDLINEFCYKIPHGQPYRSTVCGYWDRDYLLDLLVPGENPWNFEIMGSYRSSYSDGFYSMEKPLFNFVNLIEKGYWLPSSVDWAGRNNIDLALSRRPILKGRRKIISKIQELYFHAMLKVPWRYRVRLMNILRKAFISY
jgi:hypothetical protein